MVAPQGVFVVVVAIPAGYGFAATAASASAGVWGEQKGIGQHQ